MAETRHLRLYSLGLESIGRKRELAAQLESARIHEELKDCQFQPSLWSNSARSSFSDASPKLYSESVLRMRRANALRESVNQMLLPRVPMTRNTKESSSVMRKPVHVPQRQSIIVEVTKDGPDAAPVLVGKLTIERGSDFTKQASEFAALHELSAQQTKRLIQQIENSFNAYLN